MTIETEDYVTKKIMNREKSFRNSNRWRVLHTDFINNDESQGYHVTYVDGTDDPDNSAHSIQKRLDFQRLKELQSKLQDDTITDTELRELLRKKL